MIGPVLVITTGLSCLGIVKFGPRDPEAEGFFDFFVTGAGLILIGFGSVAACLVVPV